MHHFLHAHHSADWKKYLVTLVVGLLLGFSLAWAALGDLSQGEGSLKIKLTPLSLIQVIQNPGSYGPNP